MITRMTLKNFKSVKKQVYEFTNFDLLVGRNNCGKSTVLQALAIWQHCVDEFHRSTRKGAKGIQIVLPHFTALPVPEFNLLWKDRTDRAYPVKNGRKKQEFILIEITVEWRDPTGKEDSFGLELRYHSPQAIYAIPKGGWAAFRKCDEANALPRIAYVPPFSGLEPAEKWLDISPIRQQVGKGQPGSVLRNLLLRVCRPDLHSEGGEATASDWKELATTIGRWFSVDLREPKYDSARDVSISVEYGQGGKDYDVIAGGSGFHQALTLLAFLFGYQPTTILLDEPDAHLHVNLQREILDYFKRKALERGTQFLIATHAEELVRGVDASQIVSLLQQTPTRIQAVPEVLRAMADVSNDEIARLLGSPYIVYVEGESDERIIRAWANQCGAQAAIDKICFKPLGGGSKSDMRKAADAHFAALKQIIPPVQRVMLFDLDTAEDAFHPKPDNDTLVEWKRKNIENYLLVPAAWERAAARLMGMERDNLFAQPIFQAIRDFFLGQNLTLPPGRTWRNVTANIFQVVDGKLILFEHDDSLFHQLRTGDSTLCLLREHVAGSMLATEIHQDVLEFFRKLSLLTGTTLQEQE